VKKSTRSQGRIKVPVSWRISSVLSMVPLGLAIFYFIFRKSGGKFPLAAGDSTDPYFFGFLFAVLLPAIIYIFIVDKILKGIVMRQAGKDIAKNIAVDVARTATVMAAEVVLDAAVGGASSDSRSSSGSSTKGGGGEFGGSGSSGSY
jgi:uncharacterized membrane protein YgcG